MSLFFWTKVFSDIHTPHRSPPGTAPLDGVCMTNRLFACQFWPGCTFHCSLSPGKLTVSFSSLKSNDSFWMKNNTDQKRLTESKQTDRRHNTQENSAPLSWLVTSDFCFEEWKLQTSLCGAGLWFWTANSRDTLIGGLNQCAYLKCLWLRFLHRSCWESWSCNLTFHLQIIMFLELSLL